MKKLAIFLLVLALIGVIAIFGVNAWYNNAIESPAGSSKKISIFEITPGETQDQIATKLEQAGLISNKLAFTTYLKLNPNLAQGIQAGLFDLSPSMNIKEVVMELQKARRADQFKVTIPEGLRYDEIADIFAKEFQEFPDSSFKRSEYISIVEQPQSFDFTPIVEEFLSEYLPEGKNLEGFLYPETYFMEEDTTAKEVIERQITTLSETLTFDDYKAIETSDYSFYDILNIGAMIEREAFADEEKPQIADVIYKRLEQGVDGVKLLQIDATLLYIEKDWKANAFLLKNSDSPYNTYKFPGLPPGPIANPGITAIRGAIYPEANEYFYYIHDMNGQIHFARTLSEHEANVRQYL